MKTALTLGMALLAGCAGFSETRYAYLPPQEPEAQACVATCSASHSACLTGADKLAAVERDRCDEEARQDYDLCLMRGSGGDARLPCEQRRCETRPETEACDTPFRACFQACGGFIEIRQVCTINC